MSGIATLRAVEKSRGTEKKNGRVASELNDNLCFVDIK